MIYSRYIRHTRANLGKALCLLFLVICALFVFSACHESGAEPPAPPRDVTVTVMLENTGGVTVTSENPLSVKWGENAIFELSLDDGLAIDKLPAGSTLENGKLTLPSVKFPVTLRMETHRRTLCDFIASVVDETAVSISSSLTSGAHWSETEVTLTATPAEGYLFAGFSSGATIENGGAVISLDPSYTFILDQNEYYYCPNALADRGYFEREGYALLGYNTKADGSSKYYGPGWNVVMPEERNAISLFCI